MNEIKIDNVSIAPEILNIYLQCELNKNKYKLKYVSERSKKEVEILKKIKKLKGGINYEERK